MSTHYDPYPEADEIGERAVCGVLIGDSSRLSDDWVAVDCKRCLRRRVNIERAIADEEFFIVEQMGHMAEHMQEKH